MIYKWVQGRTKRAFVSFKEICKNSMWKDPASVLKYRAHSRTLPMPPQVVRYLSGCTEIYQSNDCIIMSSESEPPAFYMMQNILTSIKLKYSANLCLPVICAMRLSVGASNLAWIFIPYAPMSVSNSQM